MKDQKNKGFFRPFASLDKKIIPAPKAKSKGPTPEQSLDVSHKKDIDFKELMEGVRPLPDREKYWWHIKPKKPSFPRKESLNIGELLKIRVQDTPEYVEELVRGSQRLLFEELHAGRISVSRTLNLHRMSVEQAQEAFHVFMRECLARGDHCVLIIHGRGLSSKREPILKTKVQEWLKFGPYRRRIIGFCSARQCDGGAGATYVLLSTRPLKKSKQTTKK